MDNGIVYENEITVEVDIDSDGLLAILNNNNFIKKEEYDVNDIYMSKYFDKNTNPLEILKQCILIRNVITKEKDIKKITYKYKEYNDTGDIIKQGKIDCPIESIGKAKQLFEAIGYNEIINIKNHNVVYANDTTEMIIQYVNDKHIYIEIEGHCDYIDRVYKNIDEIKEDFNKYNIPIKDNNYFAKKAVNELLETVDF